MAVPVSVEIRDALKNIFTFHYIINILLAFSFVVLKMTPTVCSFLFDDCDLEFREMNWLIFLGCVVVLKNRKEASYRQYISTSCLFAKVLNIVLFLQQSPIHSLVYIIACLLHMVFFPEPYYKGPESVTYFRGPHLEEELERDRRVTWIIAFYAAWSPACISFAPLFAAVSNEYTLENLKFGKMDVSRYSLVAERFNISCSSWSKQLPTVIVFQDGKENTRRPYVDTKGRAIKYAFTQDSFRRDFEINNIYDRCKKHPIKKDRSKKEE